MHNWDVSYFTILFGFLQSLYLILYPLQITINNNTIFMFQKDVVPVSGIACEFSKLISPKEDVVPFLEEVSED